MIPAEVKVKPTPGWARLGELASVAGRTARTLRDWVAANAAEGEAERVRRADGGSPEVWIAPALKARLLAYYPPPEGADESREAVAAAAEAAVTAAEPPVEAVAAPVEGGGGAFDASAWSVALAALEESRRDLRLSLAEASADKLRLQSENDKLREQATQAERRAETSDTLAKRARQEAERWRTEAESVRLAWHRWRRSLDGVGRWAMWRRRLPPEPPEFSSGPALAPPESL